MTEQEKVISGLTWHFLKGEVLCRECPYFSDRDCEHKLASDVIALLKAHEPMLVKYTTSTIRCPRCNKQITSRGAIHNEIKFCWKCGQAVKWE